MNESHPNFVEPIGKDDKESRSVSDEYIGNRGIEKRKLSLIYYN